MGGRHRKPKTADLDKTEAQRCARAAARRLNETKGQWPEVILVAEKLKTLRRENHFAGKIRQAILEEGGTT